VGAVLVEQEERSAVEVVTDDEFARRKIIEFPR
jgi:hypothetical protein